jgi:hypothetical protein
VSLKPATEIGGFTDVVTIPAMDAFDEVDVLHHWQNAETPRDLSPEMRFSAFQCEMPAVVLRLGWHSQQDFSAN